MNDAGSLYVNHTQKEIRFSTATIYKALITFGWDPEDEVECHNLHFCELLPVVNMYTSSIISDLVKEDGYSVSGSAAAQLEEEHGIGTGFNDDDETLYGFDKETETIINLETGELVRSLSHLTTTTSATSSECTEGDEETGDDNSELGYDVDDDSS
jgi:hypothetical protein